MKKAMIVGDKTKQREYENILRILAEIFKEKDFQVKTIMFGEMGRPDHAYFAEMQEYDGDYICSLDMAGFQMNTLLECTGYNLLYAKQMHIVIDEQCFVKYAEGKFAISLYFFLPGSVGKWQKRYPHISNIVAYEKMNPKDTDREILQNMVDYFLDETEKKWENER